MADFQNQVNVSQAPAVAGDFASTNPRQAYLAGPGGLVAGPAGVTVARFAWVAGNSDADGAPSVVSNSGFGPVSGFVHREQQALITAYLAASGNLIQAGFGMTVMTGGDFWVKNDGAAEAVPGQKAYAAFADGKVTFAATGTPTGGATSTASTIAAGTSSVTASIADDTLNVTAVGAGTLYAGTTISGTGITTGTQIVSQISGTPGGIGQYQLNFGDQTVASTAVSGTYGLLTIGGTVTGTFAVGQTVTGSGITANTAITQAISGTGGAGTYAVNISQVIGSQAINSSLNVETKWFARSAGLPGELVKISNHPLG